MNWADILPDDIAVAQAGYERHASILRMRASGLTFKAISLRLGTGIENARRKFELARRYSKGQPLSPAERWFQEQQSGQALLGERKPTAAYMLDALEHLQLSHDAADSAGGADSEVTKAAKEIKTFAKALLEKHLEEQKVARAKNMAAKIVERARTERELVDRLNRLQRGAQMERELEAIFDRNHPSPSARNNLPDGELSYRINKYGF